MTVACKIKLIHFGAGLAYGHVAKREQGWRRVGVDAQTQREGPGTEDCAGAQAGEQGARCRGASKGVQTGDQGGRRIGGGTTGRRAPRRPQPRRTEQCRRTSVRRPPLCTPSTLSDAAAHVTPFTVYVRAVASRVADVCALLFSVRPCSASPQGRVSDFRHEVSESIWGSIGFCCNITLHFCPSP